jgi:anti-sigma factor RsiW
MHPALSFELTRQRMVEVERAARTDPGRRPAPSRRAAFVLVRTAPSVRVFRRLRPEPGEP